MVLVLGHYRWAHYGGRVPEGPHLISAPLFSPPPELWLLLGCSLVPSFSLPSLLSSSGLRCPLFLTWTLFLSAST